MNFLTATWQNLLMLNFRVEPNVLQPFVPRSLELDLHDGQAYLSVVGFQFRETKVLGVPVPYHRNFDEINLRFYTKRVERGELRRGVTFIKEVVPRHAITVVARALFQEPYQTHRTFCHDDCASSGERRLSYGWFEGGEPIQLTAHLSGEPRPLRSNSLEHFIAEHYWGYTKQRDGSTVEYRVEHPPWKVWTPNLVALTGPLADAYGATFAHVLEHPPASAIVAEGSPISVSFPVWIPA